MYIRHLMMAPNLESTIYILVTSGLKTYQQVSSWSHLFVTANGKGEWIFVVHARRWGMDHTVLPANYTNTCRYLVSVHQMALPLTPPNCSLLLIYRPWKDERLSWPIWLTFSRRFTHISGHPSVVGRALDMESSPVKDQRSTTVPRNQPLVDTSWPL